MVGGGERHRSFASDGSEPSTTTSSAILCALILSSNGAIMFRAVFIHHDRLGRAIFDHRLKRAGGDARGKRHHTRAGTQDAQQSNNVGDGRQTQRRDIVAGPDPERLQPRGNTIDGFAQADPR